jgi:hypothetical protein
MPGVFGRWLADRDARKVVDAVRHRAGPDASPGLLSGADAAARALPPSLLGPHLRDRRIDLCLIFARQAADAERRLASSYFSFGGGRNVGHDVRDAHDRALRVLVNTLTEKPGSGLADVLAAHDALIEVYRQHALDPDGYGVATLGEIRRDLEGLA